MTLERNESQSEPPEESVEVSPEVLMLSHTLGFPIATADDAAMGLTDEQKGQVLNLVGRRSDQDHSFRVLALVVGSAVFCLLVAAVIGLIVFMTLQDETGVLGAILSGLGGLIAGLGSGIGGTYWYISSKR